MKKLSLLSIVLFVFSINVQAAPTLSWSATPGTIPLSIADGVVAFGSGSSNLAGAAVFTSAPVPLPFGSIAGTAAFSHDWVFSASELTDLSAIALTTDSLTDVSVSLNGMALSSFSFGSVPFVGSLTLWNSVFQNLGAGDHTLNIAGAGLAGAFGGYAFSLAAGSPTGGGPGINPVPIPAAVWLFGSALLGVSGLASRRKTIAAEGMTA